MNKRTYETEPDLGTLIVDRVLDNFAQLPPITGRRLAEMINAAARLSHLAVDGRKESRRVAVAQFRAARRDVLSLVTNGDDLYVG